MRRRVLLSEPAKQRERRARTIWWTDYRAYLASPAWATRRARVLKKADFRCEVCTARATVVHHKTYERVGHELPEDLQALCHRCHDIAHGRRTRRRTRRRRS